jgi:hypothetical protein
MVNTSIIIVSGLPRSGTSMMMKMLEAGGVQLFVDNKRKPDYDNPNGYYEFEKVKEIDKDASWLGDSHGKAVKIVSMFLYHLPPMYGYKVIFMQRNMQEILTSQRKMLERSDPQSEIIEDGIMANKFEAHLKKIYNWIERQKNIQCLYMSYNDIMNDPQGSSTRVNTYIGGHLDINAMVESVDHSLYRNRLVS